MSRPSLTGRSPADAPPAAPGGGGRLTDARLFMLALALHLVVLGTAAAAYRAGGHDHLLRRFDARWYLLAATHGWPDAVPSVGGRIQQSTLAFFPLFPATGRVLAELTRLPVEVALAAVSLVAGALAAVVVRRIAGTYASPEVATGAALAWLLSPLAVLTTIPYSEGLYVLLAAAMVLATLRERWWAATALGALTALTRPTGVLLALVPLGAIGSAVRRRELPPLGAVATAAGPLIGFGGWLAALRWRTGRWDAWQITERRAWHAHVDAGLTQARFVLRLLLHGQPAGLATFAVLLLYGVLIVAVLAGDAPPAVKLYTLAVLLSTGLARKEMPRFLLPAFPVGVPLARAVIRRTGTRPAAVTGTVLVGLSGCVAAGIFVLVLNHEPP